MGQAKESFRYLQRAIELLHNNGWSHVELGLAYLALGDGEAALAQFQSAREVNEAVGMLYLASYWAWRGDRSARSGDWVQARNAYEQSLSNDAVGYAGNLGMGSALWYSWADRSKSILYLQPPAAVATDDTRARLLLAEAYEAMGRVGKRSCWWAEPSPKTSEVEG
jgi:tetratricopeptide (TPR) repeat protein